MTHKHLCLLKITCSNAHTPLIYVYFLQEVIGTPKTKPKVHKVLESYSFGFCVCNVRAVCDSPLTGLA